MGTLKKISVCLSSIAVVFLFLAALPVLTGGGNGVAVAANEDWTVTEIDGISRIMDLETSNSCSAWAVGETPTGQGVVLRTIDCGASWETMLTDPDARIPGTSMLCVSSNDPYIAWAGGYGYVYRTVDAGSTWEKVFSSDSYRMVPDICAVDADNAWAILDDSTQQACFIFKTSDGGATWVNVYSQPFSEGMLASISAVDNITAWAMEKNFASNGTTMPGSIIKTSDMGATWQEQTPPGGMNFNKVLAVDSANAWLACDGAIMNTTDGGTSWATSYSEASVDFRGLSAFKGVVWAAGPYSTSEGCIVRTIDHGASWEKLLDYQGSNGESLVCLDAFDTSRVAAGSAQYSNVSSTVNAKIIRTANGGSSLPDINYVSPNVAPNGEVVDINGADFGEAQDSSKVFFDGTEAASYQAWSNDTLQVEVPAGINGRHLLTVVTAAGVSNAVEIAIAAPVTITSIDPSTVYQFTVLAQIKITGSGFQPGATVTFVSWNYGTNRTYDANVVSDTEISVTINLLDLGSGAHDVSVTNPDGGHASAPLSFGVMGGCGAGAGTAAVALGGMLGMLSVGHRIRRRRRRR